MLLINGIMPAGFDRVPTVIHNYNNNNNVYHSCYVILYLTEGDGSGWPGWEGGNVSDGGARTAHRMVAAQHTGAAHH